MKNIKNFDDLVGAVGLTWAMLLCFDRLTEDFFSSLTIKQWFKVYEEVSSGTPSGVPSGVKLKEMASKKILDLALSYRDWVKIYNRLFSESDTAMEKISGMNLDFKEWLWVYDNNSVGSVPRELALRKMSESAGTIEEWVEVHRRATPRTTIKEDAFDKMLELTLFIDSPQPFPSNEQVLKNDLGPFLIFY